MRLTPVTSNMIPSKQSRNMQIFADFGKCASNSFKSGVSPKSSEVKSVFVVSFFMLLVRVLECNFNAINSGLRFLCVLNCSPCDLS